MSKHQLPRKSVYQHSSMKESLLLTVHVTRGIFAAILLQLWFLNKALYATKRATLGGIINMAAQGIKLGNS